MGGGGWLKISAKLLLRVFKTRDAATEGMLYKYLMVPSYKADTNAVLYNSHSTMNR